MTRSSRCRGAAGLGLAFALIAAPVHATPISIATLGDSLSTGAVTHPALAFDGRVLWDIFAGTLSVAPKSADLPAELAATLKDPLPPPQRLWPTNREFFGGPDWVWRNTMQTISRSYLDTAEYSWSYLLGAQLGIAPAEVALAGEDGARVSQLPRHLDRILAANNGVLPQRLVIFYTGNDLCGASMAEVTPIDDYGRDVERGLDYLLRNGTAAPGGTEVYLASHMNILQLLTSDAILDKKVRAFGGEATCRELRLRGFRPTVEQAEALNKNPIGGAGGQSLEAWYFSAVMPPSPAGFCTTLFGSSKGKEAETEVHALANRIRAFREQQAAALQRVAARLPQGGAGIRLHLLTETADVRFVGADIAQDCFHLSIAGQAKVAAAMLSGIKTAEAKR